MYSELTMMQLLNSAPKHLLTSLQDIASNVQIQSHFCIRHPDYKPLELPAESVSHFQRLPVAGLLIPAVTHILPVPERG